MKYEVKIRIADSNYTVENETDATMKQLFTMGKSLVRFGRRHTKKISFIVRDYYTGERLLVLYCRKARSGEYICRMSCFCKYGRRRKNMFF